MATKADNDHYEEMTAEQQAALEECLRLLKEAQAMIEQSLERTKRPQNSKS